MNTARIDPIVNAVLYEGYILYPYRPSSKKNSRERFTFGRVYPEGYCDSQNGVEPCVMQTECIAVVYGQSATVEVAVRFLHPMWREVGTLPGQWPEGVPVDGLDYHVVPELTVNGTTHQSWQEAVEREISLPTLSIRSGETSSVKQDFTFRALRAVEPIPGGDGRSAAAMIRRQEVLAGAVELDAIPAGGDSFKIRVRIKNTTPVSADALPWQDDIIMRTLASTHTILQVQGGEFISLIDPAAARRESAQACNNVGTWPVLVGDENEGRRDLMLSSPIILYDYPKIAPESSGSFFDGTEIDQMLSLRVLTMTDEEKREMRGVDQFARQILERTEAMSGDDFFRMHGVMRDVKSSEDFFNPPGRTVTARLGDVEIQAGSHVRIRPKNRADAFDLMLAGRVATVEAIEQDAENKIHVAVVIDDDPGRDLGLLRQPGHRFFYGLDEIEPVVEGAL